jgi:flagellar export protein FliJ
MSTPRGFRYSLEQVLLRRRWHCEALQRELGELNACLRQCVVTLNNLEGQASEVHAAWDGLVVLPQGAETFLRYHQFLAGLQAQTDAQWDALRDLEQRRDGLVDRLQEAERAQEGLEQHREQMKREFLMHTMRQEYSQADELWSLRPALRMKS